MDSKLFIPAVFALLLLSIIMSPLALHANPSDGGYEARYKIFVPYVKGISVKRLDPSLPDVPFEKWLSAFIKPGTEISWEVDDCGEDSGFEDPDYGRDYVTCVGVEAILKDGSKLMVDIAVGTVNKGISGEPQVFNGADELKSLGGLKKEAY